MRGMLWLNSHTRIESPGSILVQPRFRPHCGRNLAWGRGWGSNMSSVDCAKKAAVRTSPTKQILFRTRCRSRAFASATSFDRLPSFSGRRRLRPARNPPSSEIPNLPAPATRRRCNATNGLGRHQQACRSRQEAYPVCPARWCGPDTDCLAGNCELLHRGPADGERRKVRYERFDRRASYVAVWH